MRRLLAPADTLVPFWMYRLVRPAASRRPALLLLLLLLAAAATGAGANLDDDDWVFDEEEEEGDGEGEEEQLSPEDKLMDGARGDDIELVREALAEGADPNLTLEDETKWSVLMLSIYRAQIGRWVGPAGAQYRSTGAEIARVLLEAGADVNYRRPIPGGGTALAYAAEWGRPEAVKVLIEMGAEVDGRSHGKKVEEEKKTKGRKNRKKNKKVKMGGNTPLMAVRARIPQWPTTELPSQRNRNRKGPSHLTAWPTTACYQTDWLACAVRRERGPGISPWWRHYWREAQTRELLMRAGSLRKLWLISRDTTRSSSC